MSKRRKAKRKHGSLSGLKGLGVGIGVFVAILICALLFAPSPAQRTEMTATALVRTQVAGDAPKPTKSLTETEVAALQVASAIPAVAAGAIGTTIDPRRATQFAQLTALAATVPSAETPGVTNAPPEIWYMARTGNLRSCPRIDCDQVAQLSTGTAITLVGLVHGEMYLSSDIWRLVDYQGQQAYVHSSLVGTSPPVATLPPVVIVTSAPVSVPPVANVSCPSLTNTCDQLTCAQAQACLAAGNQSLDWNHDGTACNAQCR